MFRCRAGAIVAESTMLPKDLGAATPAACPPPHRRSGAQSTLRGTICRRSPVNPSAAEQDFDEFRFAISLLKRISGSKGRDKANRATICGRDTIRSQTKSAPPGAKNEGQIVEMNMKAAMILTLILFASGASAADCVKNARGKTICSNGEKAVAVNPNTGTVTTAQQKPGGVTTVQKSNGTKVAVNPKTGNAAVAQTNQNGVTTTNTARGGQAKTKNGMGVATGPNGTTCAKGVNNAGCTKQP